METRNMVIALAAVAFAGAVYAAEPQQQAAPQTPERKGAAVAGTSAAPSAPR